MVQVLSEKSDYEIIVNHKKLSRLCKLHGLQLKRPKRKRSKFGKMAANHKVTRINLVWEFDIKYGYLNGERKFFFLLAFIDVFSREIKGWYLGYHCKARDLASTLKLALNRSEVLNVDRLILRSDNGPHMRASLFRDSIADLPADHEFIPIRSPNKNAHIESFFSIYDKHMQEQYFWILKDAYQWTMEFMDFYNHDRIHPKEKGGNVRWSRN